MTLAAYRDLEYVAAVRFDEMRLAHAARIEELSTLRNMIARREARTAAGIVGTGAGVLVFAAAILEMAEGKMLGASTVILLLAWPLMLAAYLIARPLARRRIDAALAASLARAPDASAVHDLARLESSDPARAVASILEQRERASATFPLVALSLLAPLSLHFIAALALYAIEDKPLTLRDYGTWIAISTVIVGHAHLTLAVCAWRYAKKLHARSVSELYAGFTGDWVTALAFTTLAGALPGALLIFIPPILVVITGLVFIPAMYVSLGRRILRERVTIESEVAARPSAAP